MTRALLSSKAAETKKSRTASGVASTAASSCDTLATLVDPPQAWVVPLPSYSSTAPPVKPAPNAGYAEMLDGENAAWGAPGRKWWQKA